MSAPGNQDGFPGQNTNTTSESDYNQLVFMVWQILRLCSTATLVKVISCTSNGGIAPVGRVDVQPLVKMVDGLGNTSSHGPLHNLLYCRMQGGAQAVILDPKAGDIGLAVFADRDISAVKKNLGEAQPGSRRRFDMADGVYLFTVASQDAPTEYVAFTPDGIQVKSPNPVMIDTSELRVTGDVKANWSESSPSDAISVKTHTHGGVETGGGNTGEPNPG